MKISEIINPVDLAKTFHRNYERLAPGYDYKTRSRSAVPWKEVPKDNQMLMIATAKAVLKWLDRKITYFSDKELGFPYSLT